jgi:hypothetical protein
MSIRRCILAAALAFAAFVGCSSSAGEPIGFGDGGGDDGGSSSGSSGSGSSGSSSGGTTSSGSGSSSGGHSSGGSGGSSGGEGSGGSSGSGSSSGGAVSCSSPGSYTMNGGACGTERWDIKTGTDSQAPGLSLVPQATTIAMLVTLPAAGGGASRESPTETTLWELKDVTLTMIKSESDSDYHMVVSDGTNTMIIEIPYPGCDTGGAWTCFIQNTRSLVDSKFTVSSSPQYPAQTVTVRGFGFFDSSHGQTGVAPNAIELHPVLQICFGQGCTPG